MSFFRNLRSSITRGRSSSRDTTPVRSRSRPGSVISSLNSVGTNGHGSGSAKRRDSIESRTDSLLNRSETFILDESPQVTPIHSNCSTLEKKSKKSKVLEKFSTFTKRKKTPTPEKAFDHHPSDNATNTYYKWQADGGNSLDYDSQSDPFNFLYEQQSSLKTLHGNMATSSNTESLRSTGSNSSVNYEAAVPCYRKGSPKSNFDSTTYRKGKMPTELKKQLVQWKQSTKLAEQDDDNDDDQEAGNEDKFKTVTLNSFRKSFRDKFLQQQKEAAYNPAWFVEVEAPPATKARESSKENRRDLLVFDNDNYRPGSRSPVRDPNKTNARPQTRSPIKRNETFKVDRVSRNDRHLTNTPDEATTNIRIEFKNSITPHMPGRMVPVGVAKPMLAQFNDPQMHASYTIKSNSTSSTRLNNHSPPRNWSKPLSPTRSTMVAPTQRMGRYQTLVQIKNDKAQQQAAAAPQTTRTSRLSTRIQLTPDAQNKRYNTSRSPAKYQPLKQTYFGETPYCNSPQQSRVMATANYANATSHGNNIKTFSHNTNRTTATPVNYGRYQPVQFQAVSANATISALRSTPSHNYNNSNNTPSNNTLHDFSTTSSSSSYLKHQQPRIVVAAPRRSRSPIKIPWR